MGVVRELWPHSHEGRCDACRRAWFGAPLRLRTLEDFESKKPAVEEVSRSQRVFSRVAPSLLPFCICRVFAPIVNLVLKGVARCVNGALIPRILQSP
jgi:hypothetical protein